MRSCMKLIYIRSCSLVLMVLALTSASGMIADELFIDDHLIEEKEGETLEFQPSKVNLSDDLFYVKMGVSIPIDDEVFPLLSVGVGMRHKWDRSGVDIGYTQVACLGALKMLYLFYPSGKNFYFGIGGGYFFIPTLTGNFSLDQVIGYRWPSSKIFVQLEFMESPFFLMPGIFVGRSF